MKKHSLVSKLGPHCKYCGSQDHKDKDCRLARAARAGVISYGVEIDASTPKGLEQLFKAIEIIHDDKVNTPHD